MVNQRTLTHAHQEALHSSLFVSYLYNYFKVSTDFGFPFREKTIKPCSPGLSGGSVRIISLQTSAKRYFGYVRLRRKQASGGIIGEVAQKISRESVVFCQTNGERGRGGGGG